MQLQRSTVIGGFMSEYYMLGLIVIVIIILAIKELTDKY